MRWEVCPLRDEEDSRFCLPEVIVQLGIVLMLLEQSIGRVCSVGKISHLGFTIDNAVLKIFTSYNRKLKYLTFFSDLVLEVFLGEPLI